MPRPTREPVSVEPERGRLRGLLSVSALFMAVLLVCWLHPPWGLGPGVQDFDAVLLGSYKLNRTSAHQVYISQNGALDPTVPSIPKKVLECGVHAPFILGKRQGLKPRSLSAHDTYETPDTDILDYWILDTRGQGKVFGPSTLAEFNSQRVELGIPASVTMRDVYSYRR